MKYIIDESGRQIFCATKAHYFCEGLCAVQVGGKWGFLNTSGKIVIPCQYDDVWNFKNGTAAVKFNDKYGLINKNGKFLAPLQYKDYDQVPQPHDGVVCIDIGSKNKYIAKCIDIDGNTLFTKEVRTTIEFSDGLATVWDSKGYSVIDKAGNQIIPNGIYDYIWDFKCGVARVQKGTRGEYGYIDKSGAIVVPLQYSYFDDESFPIVIAHSEKGVVCLDARTGTAITPLSSDSNKYKSSAFTNTDDMVVIDVKDSDTVYFYDKLSRRSFSISNIKYRWRFSNGLCAVVSKKPGQSGFIDKTGTLVLPYDFGDGTRCLEEFHRGCCALDGIIINKKGEVLRRIPPRHKVRYSSPNVVEDGFWIESGPDMLSSQYGTYHGEALLNDMGKIVYTGYSIDTYGTSLICVKAANINGKEKWGYINRAGKLVIPYQFTESSTFNHGFTIVDEPVTKRQKGCYIATSVYGSYDTPNVWVLRRYRDFYLSKFAIGRAFIRMYYRISPTLVKTAGDSMIFKGFFKRILDRFVGYLRSRGYSDAPYFD